MKIEGGLSEKHKKSSRSREVEKGEGLVGEVCSHYMTYLSETSL